MASSSMLNNAKFTKVGTPIPVLDVHNQTQWTKGLYNFQFSIKNSNVASVAANVHLADNLSSTVIFGMDWLRTNGGSH